MAKEEPIKNRIQLITRELRRYLERRLELFAIEAGDQFSQLMTEILFRITGLLFLIGGVLFAAVALAIYIGGVLGSESLGYLIVAIPVIFIGFLVVNLKPSSLVKRTKNQMLQRMMDTIPKDTPKSLPKHQQSLSDEAVKRNGQASKKRS